MKRILPILISLSIIFSSNVAHSDELTLPQAPNPVEGEVDVGSAISPMKKGDKAIFTGLLLSPRAIATIIAQSNVLKSQISIEVQKARGEEQAQCDFRSSEQKTTLETDKKILQTTIKTYQRDIEILSARLKEEQSSKKDTQLWTGLGFAGGVVATIITVFAVKGVIK